MEIWLDTIEEEIVSHAAQIGLVSGITTNPYLLAQSSNIPETLKFLLKTQPGPVAVQVTSKSALEMLAEAKKICAFSNRFLVKVPIDQQGLLAIKKMKKEEIPVLGTGVVTLSQALLAGSLEIPCIALYFSHMEDPLGTLKAIVDLFKAARFRTKILVASLKELDHALQCALLGVDALTLKPDVYHQFVADHPKTVASTQKFLNEWTQVRGHPSIQELL